MDPGFRRETDLEQPIEPFRKHLAGVDEVGEADLEGAAEALGGDDRCASARLAPTRMLTSIGPLARIAR
jgi:hypothetical protein